MVKRVSLKDIAEKEGVSIALVSYVMNGKEKEKRVGADVVERIRRTARELNYKPNQIAKSLRTGATKTIGLIVADIANPFFGNLARVIEDEAGKYGYSVIIGSSDEDGHKSAVLMDLLVDRQVDGFIIVPAEGTASQIKSLINKGIPLVLADRYFEQVTTNFVMLDNYEASYEATSHLIENGYQKIGMIAYKSGLIHMRERIAGYVDAMKARNREAEIRVEEIRYSHVNADIEKAMNHLIKGKNRIDALIFATCPLTIAGLYSIRRLDLKVPDDLALIGYDANEAYDFFYSPITYIEQPIAEIGRESVHLLLDQIGGSEKVAQIRLKHKFIIRASSI